MNTKQFIKRLNEQLDEINAPEDPHERAKALADLLHIPKQNSHMILRGSFMPPDTIMKAMSEEFDVSVAWLKGESDKK